MKLEKAAEAVKKWKICSRWNKKAKKWSKRKKHMKWIARIYRKRRKIGNVIYSVMYLTLKKD